MPTPSNAKSILAIIVISLVLVMGYYVLTAPDRRNMAEKVGDAIHALPDGDKAARELKSRTPAEKLDDAAKDAGENIRKSTNQQK